VVDTANRSLTAISTVLAMSLQADACISTIDGSLTPGFQYLRTLMNNARKEYPFAQRSMILSFEGHLFDSGLINQILDVIEHYGSGVRFKECIFPPQSGRASSKSHVVLKIDCADEASLALVEKKIRSLVDAIEKAEASVVRIDRPTNDEANHHGHVYVDGPKRKKRVLLLGAGRVSKSFVAYLGRSGHTVITVASDKEAEARDAASAAEKGQHVTLNVVDDVQRLSTLIEDADLVVSLLPAPMHPPVAIECIVRSTNLVTASYESEEMRGLTERAKNANIVILNEVGLDPGLDRGGRVTCFSSVCGGLPTPEAADNPLKYKFSWSPKGVIRASQSKARYRWEGRVKEVQGYELLLSAAPFLDAWHNLELECLPNRDSLHYDTVYGIHDAPTLFRGTLRYRGFSMLMNTFQNMGLFDSSIAETRTWADLIEVLRTRRGGFKNVPDFVLACADENPDEADRALDTLEWLDMLGQKPVTKTTTVVDAFCDALEQKLVYEEGERDMVLMHHTIKATFDDGSQELHRSSLQVFGDDSMSAMSKTVGFTAAASAELILGGTLTGESGLILPTNRKVYLPVLERLKFEDIIFDESASCIHPPRLQRQL
jgi:alpha-aminoadipic semialdehyde synthase